MSAEVIQWIDPAGSVTTLDVDWSASGRFAPDPAFEEDGVPGQPGQRFRAVRHKLREFAMLITLSAVDEPTLRAQQRALAYAMDPVRGAGKIRVTSVIGDQREINCRVSAGMGTEEKPGSAGVGMQQLPLVFHCNDPYWSTVADSVQSWAITITPTFFPFFPLRLTASQIAVSTTMVNPGDIEAWPVWTIHGPGNSIALRNLGTGDVTVLSTTALGAGDTLVIDTRPGYKTVTKGDGTNLFWDLTPTSALWALAVGTTQLRLEMAGAVVGTSSLQLTYRPRYLSP